MEIKLQTSLKLHKGRLIKLMIPARGPQTKFLGIRLLETLFGGQAKDDTTSLVLGGISFEEELEDFFVLKGGSYDFHEKFNA